MDIDQIHQILIEAGAHTIPHDIEGHRPEIVNLLLAEPEAITGQTIPEMIAPAWPGRNYMEVAARLSREPWRSMTEDIRDWLLAEGWYWRDTPDGRRWFPPEFDSSGWAEVQQSTGGAAASPFSVGE